MMNRNSKKYVDKDGYEIMATEKAYNMMYKAMGFLPKEEPSNENTDSGEKTGSGESEKSLTVKELRELLTDAGVAFNPKAKREELLNLWAAHLAERANNSNESGDDQSAEDGQTGGVAAGQEETSGQPGDAE